VVLPAAKQTDRSTPVVVLPAAKQTDRSTPVVVLPAAKYQSSLSNKFRILSRNYKIATNMYV